MCSQSFGDREYLPLELVMKRKSCGWNWKFLLQVPGVQGT
jgi:hypothetical protein